MGKTKTRKKASFLQKFPCVTSDEEFCENWERIEAKLNKWIDLRLPAIIQLKLQERYDPAVYKLITSSKFCESVSEGQKFDLEKCRKIEKKLAELKDLKNALTCQLDDLEQYTRRTNNYSDIWHTREQYGEYKSSDNLAMNFVKEELGVDLKPEDISRSQRISNRSSKPKPIIVRLPRHNNKVEILQKRRVFKQNEMPYNVQDLSQPRRDILKYLIKDIPLNIIDKVWTVDGVICMCPSQHTSTIERCTTMAKCHEIVRKYSPSWADLAYGSSDKY